MRFKIGFDSANSRMREICMAEFETKLKELINLHAKQNASATPDFILAEYILACLNAFNRGVNQREKWYCDASKLMRSKDRNT